MKLIRRFSICIFLLSSLTLGSNQNGTVHGIDTTAIDPTIRPGNDFFSYANGNWIKSTEIPPDQARWGTFRILREESIKQTADLLSNRSKNSKPSDRKSVV